MQDRLVLGVGEPLAWLRGHPGGRQVLEELLRLACAAGGPQRLGQQRAATALRGEHEIGRRMRGHRESLTGHPVVVFKDPFDGWRRRFPGRWRYRTDWWEPSRGSADTFRCTEPR